MPKQEKYDSEILDEAMNNAYQIVTGKITFDEILERDTEACIPFDIRKEKPDLEAIIEYFIETEEYEKCQEIKDIIDNGRRQK